MKNKNIKGGKLIINNIHEKRNNSSTLFSFSSKTKIYLDDAIENVKQILSETDFNKSTVCRKLNTRYLEYSIPNFDQTYSKLIQNYKKSSKEKELKILRRKFAYEKLKYYIILYCLGNYTISNNPSAKKVNDKIYSFKRELEKVYSPKNYELLNPFLADQIVYSKVQLFRDRLLNLMEYNEDFNMVKNLCISALNDDDYVSGGLSINKNTPFNTTNNIENDEAAFKKEILLNLLKGKIPNSNKNYKINNSNIHEKIKEITGTTYESDFYNNVTKQTDVGKTIENHLKQMNNNHGIIGLGNLGSELLLKKRRNNYTKKKKYGGKKPVKKTTTKKPVKKTVKKPVKKTTTKKPVKKTVKKPIKKTTTKKPVKKTTTKKTVKKPVKKTTSKKK